MAAEHAGDVENDAGDVDGLVQNTSILRENAVKYSICLSKTKNGKQTQKKMKKSRNKFAPKP